MTGYIVTAMPTLAKAATRYRSRRSPRHRRAPSKPEVLPRLQIGDEPRSHDGRDRREDEQNARANRKPSSCTHGAPPATQRHPQPNNTDRSVEARPSTVVGAASPCPGGKPGKAAGSPSANASAPLLERRSPSLAPDSASPRGGRSPSYRPLDGSAREGSPSRLHSHERVVPCEHAAFASRRPTVERTSESGEEVAHGLTKRLRPVQEAHVPGLRKLHHPGVRGDELGPRVRDRSRVRVVVPNQDEDGHVNRAGVGLEVPSPEAAEDRPDRGVDVL